MNAKKLEQIVDQARDVSANDVFGVVGLERRRSTAARVLPGVALFGAGLLVGAGVALLFAPQDGASLRKLIRKRATKLEHKLESQMEAFGMG